MLNKLIIFIMLHFVVVLNNCNVVTDIHQKSDGRSDDYKNRKCFVECVERRMAVNPLPKGTDYYDACWPVYVYGCSN